METGDSANIPSHVAIIMDGNGRWAQQRGLPRVAGHRQGVEVVRKITRAAREHGIEYLTLYSFSTENWSRPEAEIGELFSLLKVFIRRDLAELHQNNVRLLVIGQREGVPDDILILLDDACRLTFQNTGQTLIIAFNYGGRAEIADAARMLAERVLAGEITPSQIDETMLGGALQSAQIPDPDLIIRTSGEKRISNFLLWQAAYSELVFFDVCWPEFGEKELAEAIAEYAGRKRRYGGAGPVNSRDTGS